MGKFSCPYCYERHTEKDCKCMCSYYAPGADEKYKYCKYGYRSDAGFIDPKYINKCLKCSNAVLKMYCPHSSIGSGHVGGKKLGLDLPIPQGCRGRVNLSIALIGAKSVGKSNYIAMLIQEIKNRMAKDFHCAVIAADDSTMATYEKEFYKPIFEEHTAAGATDQHSVIPPMIYSLEFDGDARKSVSLTFYDTAGENFNDMDTMLEKGYITNADGIIVLLDPLQLTRVRDQFTKLGKGSELPEQKTDTSDILDRVINIYREVKKVKKKIDVPIALAFSKMDMLMQYDILSKDSCLREESEHLGKGVFVESDFKNTQNEMLTLLDNMVDSDLEFKLGTFKDHAFFGLSALGTNPVGKDKKLSEGAVKPHRVLDPLLWILAQNGFIKTIK